ncbi:MAG: GntR family transcriptional regulator [Anaerolineales bacterium]|nr:GntR family transcriptional regulator [Anaerolineales bacterium]
MSNFPFQRLQSKLSVLIAGTPAGDRLPSEPQLARKLGVSRATLREAMRTFETQGLIRRRQGAGTFVVGQVPVLDSGLEVLESLDTMAQRLNLAVTVSDMHVDRVYADHELADGLKLPLASSLISIRRVIRADGRPVAYLVDTLPEEVLKPEDLPGDFNGSVLDFLIARGIPLTISRAAISATGATAEVARALEIQREDVLLKFTSQLYIANGSVVDYSVSSFIPGYFNFHVIRRVGNG